MFGTRTERGQKQWVPKVRKTEQQPDEFKENSKPQAIENSSPLVNKECYNQRNSDFFDNSVPQKNHWSYQ